MISFFIDAMAGGTISLSSFIFVYLEKNILFCTLIHFTVFLINKP